MVAGVLRSSLLAGVLCLSAGSPLFGHHSLATEFQVDQTITLDGVVTKLDWSNPHARLYIEGSDPSGAKQLWDFEMASPNLLLLHGWKINTFRKGDHVEVSAHPSRDGSHHAFATKVTLVRH